MKLDLPTYDKFRSIKYFTSLDGLRCLSILAVIYYHTAGHLSFNQFLHSGYFGVQIFFSISGFLITTLLLREKEKTGNISLVKFYIRRTLRIFPIYYTVLLSYVILVPIVEKNSELVHQFFHNLKFYVTYTSNLFIDHTHSRVIFYFAWSLATEEQFYLMWPAVEKFLSSKWNVGIIIGILGISQMTQQGFLDLIFPPDTLPYRILVNISSSICLGVLSAHVLHSPKGFDWIKRFIGYRWSCLILCMLICLLLYKTTIILFWIEFILALFVISCVIREDHWFAWILNWWPIRQIGIISYGMYLMHMECYHLVLITVVPLFHFNEPWFLFLTTTLLTIIVAAISYRFYESYFLNLKKKYEPKEYTSL